VGKRISAVAVLLATSFLGSLLALVLIGRNPLVGPSSTMARTETLRPDVDGSPVSVLDASLAGSPTASSVPSTASQVVGSQTAGDPGPAEGRYRNGPVSADGAEDEPGPPPASESAPPLEEDDALAKTTSEASEPGPGNGKAKGHDKAKHGDDAVADGSSGSYSRAPISTSGWASSSLSSSPPAYPLAPATATRFFVICMNIRHPACISQSLFAR
jgi:hypothetical protein